jgi:hypothetical protein
MQSIIITTIMEMLVKRVTSPLLLRTDTSDRVYSTSKAIIEYKIDLEYF